MDDTYNQAAQPAAPAPAPVPAAPPVKKRGLFRRFFGGLWWLVDGSRRLVLNMLFLLIVGLILIAWLRSGTPPLQDKTVLVLNLTGPLVDQRFPLSSFPRKRRRANVLCLRKHFRLSGRSGRTTAR